MRAAILRLCRWVLAKHFNSTEAARGFAWVVVQLARSCRCESSWCGLTAHYVRCLATLRLRNRKRRGLWLTLASHSTRPRAISAGVHRKDYAVFRLVATTVRERLYIACGTPRDRDVTVGDLLEFQPLRLSEREQLPPLVARPDFFRARSRIQAEFAARQPSHPLLTRAVRRHLRRARTSRLSSKAIATTIRTKREQSACDDSPNDEDADQPSRRGLSPPTRGLACRDARLRDWHRRQRSGSAGELN